LVTLKIPVGITGNAGAAWVQQMKPRNKNPHAPVTRCDQIAFLVVKLTRSKLAQSKYVSNKI